MEQRQRSLEDLAMTFWKNRNVFVTGASGRPGPWMRQGRVRPRADRQARPRARGEGQLRPRGVVTGLPELRALFGPGCGSEHPAAVARGDVAKAARLLGDALLGSMKFDQEQRLLGQ